MGLFKTFLNYLLKMPVLALALGIVLVCVVALNMLDAYTPELAVVGYEGFADEEPKEDADEEAPDADEEEDAEEVEAEEPFSAPSKKFGGRPKGTKNHRHNRDRKQSFALGKKQEDADDDVHLDAGTTALMAFNKLSPDQVRMMRNDTQELIRTQKELMSTFQSMAPLLSEGKKLMDTFGGYFKE